MSDMYLVLRRRLEGVPEWVFLDTAVLRAARERAGLSYESLARQVPVSSKTWERYEKGGRVPRHLVRRVAELLDLEIEEPRIGPLIVSAGGGDEGEPDLERVLAEVQAVRREVQSLRETVESLQGDHARSKQGRGRAR